MTKLFTIIEKKNILNKTKTNKRKLKTLVSKTCSSSISSAHELSSFMLSLHIFKKRIFFPMKYPFGVIQINSIQNQMSLHCIYMVIKSICALTTWTLYPIKSIRMTTCHVNKLLNTFDISFTSSISFVHPTFIHFNVPIISSTNTFLLDRDEVSQLVKQVI